MAKINKTDCAGVDGGGAATPLAKDQQKLALSCRRAMELSKTTSAQLIELKDVEMVTEWSL